MKISSCSWQLFFMAAVATAIGQTDTNNWYGPSVTNYSRLQYEVVTNYSRTPISIGSRPKEGCSQIGCLVYHCESIDSPTDYNETETVIKKTLLKYDTGNHKGEIVLDQEELSKKIREIRQKTFMQTNEWKKVEEIKWSVITTTNTATLYTTTLYFTNNILIPYVATNSSLLFATNTSSWNFVEKAKNLTKAEKDYYNSRADAMRVLPWGPSVDVVRQEVETIDSLRDIQNKMTAITNMMKYSTNGSISLTTSRWQSMTNQPDKQEEIY